MALFHIKTISSFEIEHIIDAKDEAQARQKIFDKDFEFAQTHLGEGILSSKLVSDEDYLKLFKQHNPHVLWSDDFILAKVNRA
jgi:hypothetical protein